MLFIDDQLRHIVSINQEHCQLITCYVNRKIYGASTKFDCKNPSCAVCTNDIRQVKKLSARFKNAFSAIDIKRVISGKPNELHRLSQRFHAEYFSGLARNSFTPREKKILESIFNYTWFTNKENTIYSAYDLCNELKIESCVYCNRSYTSTIINEKSERIIRPTLDHWYTQKDHPILALSFYNLVPSCSSCNSYIKHVAVFDLTNYVHPYVQKDITKQYTLDYKYDTSLNKYQISVNTTNKKIKKTLKEMYIADIYSHHQSEIEDLDLLKRKYSKKYLKDLGAILGKTLTEKDIYRILFGVEYDDENFYKRPLSKFKKDILNLKLK